MIMSIMSIFTEHARRNRDKVTVSLLENKVLTNFYEGCHGDFAYLPEQYTAAEEDKNIDYNQRHNTFTFAYER